jgi:hypothetical protein
MKEEADKRKQRLNNLEADILSSGSLLAVSMNTPAETQSCRPFELYNQLPKGLTSSAKKLKRCNVGHRVQLVIAIQQRVAPNVFSQSTFVLSLLSGVMLPIVLLPVSHDSSGNWMIAQKSSHPRLPFLN